MQREALLMTLFKTRCGLLAAALLWAPMALGAEAAVKVEDPWVRVTFGQSTTTAGYMALIDTSGKGNALVGIELAGGAKADLHETVRDGDMVKMRMVKRLPIPPGGRAELTPSGGHIMIEGLKSPLKVGETLPMSLKFADGTEKMAYFAVRTN